MGGPTWDERYPDPDCLIDEVERLAESFVEALLDSIPRSELRVIYLKGSAKKRCDSPPDNVPEISDVDIWFREDDGWRSHLATLSQAMEVQREVSLRGTAPRLVSPCTSPDPSSW